MPFRYIIIIIRIDRLIGLEGRVFANGPGNLSSVPSRVIPKTLKMVLDNSLLNTQQYKVHIKGKVEQSRERSSTLLYTSKREPYGCPRLKGDNFTYFIIPIIIIIIIIISYEIQFWNPPCRFWHFDPYFKYIQE